MKTLKILVAVVVTSTFFVFGNVDSAKIKNEYYYNKIVLIPVTFSDVEPKLAINDVYNAIKNTNNPQSIASYIKTIGEGKFQLDFGSFSPNKWLKLKKKRNDYWVGIRDVLTKDFINDSIKLAKENGLNVKEYDNNATNSPDYCIFYVAGVSKDDVPWYFGSYADCEPSIFLNEDSDKAASDKNKWQIYNLTIFMIYNSLENLSFKKNPPVGIWDFLAESDELNCVGLCAFNRWKLGVIDIPEISQPGTYEIDDLNGNGKRRAYKIKIPGTVDEWIIIENRQKTGLDAQFDGIQSTGLVMYHYDNGIEFNSDFNRIDEYINKSTFGLKVFDNDPDGKYHTKAVWSQDVGKTEMSWRNSKDNEPLYIKGYTGKHILIKNISKSGPTMTFELAYENNSPDHMTDVETLDFGKIRKGLKKTLPVNFFNNGAIDVRCDFSSSSSWITADPKVSLLGQETINVSVDTSELDFGNRSGKLDFRTNSVEGVVNITVEVTNPVGDVNGDFKVTIEDADLFMKHYGAKAGDQDYDITSDFNEDGVINIDDFFLISRYFVTK